MGRMHLVSLAGVALSLLLIAWAFVQLFPAPAPLPTNFEECVAAGNPIMESYPRRCRAGDLEFTESVPTSVVPRCVIAGCSGEICAEESEAPLITTTCEYRAEYSCFAITRCARQQNGHCAWTATPEFAACLASPGNPEEEPQAI